MQVQALRFAVLGQKREALCDRRFGACDLYLLAVNEDLAAVELIRAEDRADDLRSSGADQPRKTEDLALVQLE